MRVNMHLLVQQRTKLRPLDEGDKWEKTYIQKEVGKNISSKWREELIEKISESDD